MHLQEGIFAPFVVFLFIAIITKLILDYRLRNRIIEKGAAEENLKLLLPPNSSHTNLSSLKWGMVLVGLGLGIIVGQEYDWRRGDGEFTVAFMLIFGGFALALFYGIASFMTRKARENNPIK
jgi:hypothetical protein